MTFLKAIRYGVMGVFVAGIISVIQGCTIKEGAGLVFVLFMLTFCSGPPPVTELVLYSAGHFDGDLRAAGGNPTDPTGRAGADNLCVAAKPADLMNPNVRAFISVTPADSVANMPDNYGVPTNLPVVGPTGIPIADDWEDLFIAPDLFNSLNDARVTESTIGFAWWSGSQGNGAAATDRCQAWTTNAGTSNGNAANGALVGVDGWIDSGLLTCDNTTTELVCIGF